jgi:hypothetical protein
MRRMKKGSQIGCIRKQERKSSFFLWRNPPRGDVSRLSTVPAAGPPALGRAGGVADGGICSLSEEEVELAGRVGIAERVMQ